MFLKKSNFLYVKQYIKKNVKIFVGYFKFFYITFMTIKHKIHTVFYTIYSITVTVFKIMLQSNKH